MTTLLPVAVLLAACGRDTPRPRADRTPASPPTAEVPRSPVGAPRDASATPNLLFLLVDDLGADKLASYGVHPAAPITPRLDALAREGVRFTNAYAHPLCSPSRAAAMTGRFGRRVGIGAIIEVNHDDSELPLAEVVIPEMLALAPHPYTSVAIGKWHLGSFDGPSGLRHPLRQGFSHFFGTWGNLNVLQLERGKGNYQHYELVVDGELRPGPDRYPASVYVDEALRQIPTLPEPWFVYLAFNDVHEPITVPPRGLNEGRVTESSTLAEKHAAMVVALDQEIGRLLDGMDPEVRRRTTIVVTGDNGTSREVVLPPLDASDAKGTVMEGGIHVPLIVSGPSVARPGVSPALVHLVDLWPTFAELAGVDPAKVKGASGAPVELDGKSLVPALTDPERGVVHETLYNERFAPSGPGPYDVDLRSLRDERYKVVWKVGADRWTLYDLKGRFDDGPPVERPFDDDQQRHFQALQTELKRLATTVNDEYR